MDECAAKLEQMVKLLEAIANFQGEILSELVSLNQRLENNGIR